MVLPFACVVDTSITYDTNVVLLYCTTVTWRGRALLEAGCPYAVYEMRLFALGLPYAPCCRAAGLDKHVVSVDRIVWYAPCWPFSICFNISGIYVDGVGSTTYQLDFECHSDEKDGIRTRPNTTLGLWVWLPSDRRRINASGDFSAVALFYATQAFTTM